MKFFLLGFSLSRGLIVRTNGGGIMEECENVEYENSCEKSIWNVESYTVYEELYRDVWNLILIAYDA